MIEQELINLNSIKMELIDIPNVYSGIALNYNIKNGSCWIEVERYANNEDIKVIAYRSNVNYDVVHKDITNDINEQTLKHLKKISKNDLNV